MLETINENSQDENKSGEVEPRHNKTPRTEKYFSLDFLTFVIEGEPRTFKEAMNSSESLMWKKTIKSEIDSILYSHT